MNARRRAVLRMTEFIVRPTGVWYFPAETSHASNHASEWRDGAEADGSAVLGEFEVKVGDHRGRGQAAAVQSCAESLIANGACKVQCSARHVRWHGSLHAYIRGKHSDDSVRAILLESVTWDCYGALLEAFSETDWTLAWQLCRRLELRVIADTAAEERLGLPAAHFADLARRTMCQAHLAWLQREEPCQERSGALLVDLEGASCRVTALVPPRLQRSAPRPAQLARQRVERSTVVPSWLASRRDECVIEFDAARYGLATLVADLLGVDQRDLHRLHRLELHECRWPLHPLLSRAFRRAGLHSNLPPEAVRCSYGEAAQRADTRQQSFLAAFRRFCEEVAVPSCAGAARRVMCQVPPTSPSKLRACALRGKASAARPASPCPPPPSPLTPHPSPLSPLPSPAHRHRRRIGRTLLPVSTLSGCG